MESVGSHIQTYVENMKQSQDNRKNASRSTNIRCLKCKANIHFGSAQYRIECPNCKNVIRRSCYTSMTEKKTKCKACDDYGVVYFHVQVENYMQQQVARCVCDAGDRYAKVLPLITNVPDVPVDVCHRVLFPDDKGA